MIVKHDRLLEKHTRQAGLGEIKVSWTRLANATTSNDAMLSSNLPNYRRVLEAGGAQSAGDVAIVGDEASVADQIAALFEAGATDLWAAVFTVGDRERSKARTRALLAELASTSTPAVAR